MRELKEVMQEAIDFEFLTGVPMSRTYRLQVARPEDHTWTEVDQWTGSERELNERKREQLLSPTWPRASGDLVRSIWEASDQQRVRGLYVFDQDGALRRLPDQFSDPIGDWWGAKLQPIYRLIPDDLDRGCLLHRQLVRAGLELTGRGLPAWEKMYPTRTYPRQVHTYVEQWCSHRRWLGGMHTEVAVVWDEFLEFRNGRGWDQPPPLTEKEIPVFAAAENVFKLWELSKNQKGSFQHVVELAATYLPGGMKEALDVVRRWVSLRDVLLEHAIRYPVLTEGLQPWQT